MIKLKQPGEDAGSGDATFLPEDYVERKAERRSDLICFTLFVVLLLGVVGAVFVQNRRWNDVRLYQEAINVRYTQAAKDIEQLKLLEKQKSELLQKAELTTALIERVPRSILLAELINRMPNRMMLLEFEMDSDRVKGAAGPPAPRMPASGGVGRSLTSTSAAGGSAETPAATPPDAPRFETSLSIVGLAPTNRDVARYVAALQGCELLENVELRFTELAIVRDRELTKFRVDCELRDEADARRITPADNPRLVNFDETGAPDPRSLELDDETTASVPGWEDEK